MKLLIWIDKSKTTVQNKVPLLLRITIDGKRLNINTTVYVGISEWDQAKQKVKGNSEVAKSANKTIDTFKQNAVLAYEELLRLNKPITVETVVSKMLGKDEPKKSLLEAVTFCKDDIESQIGKGYSLATFKKFKTIEKKLKAYILKDYNRDDIFLAELNYNFIQSFSKYMKLTEGVGHNGMIKNMQQLRRVINTCIKNGWIKNDPFANFSMKLQKNERGYLTQEELKKIETVILKTPKLYEARDIFVFSCYTGISYKDVKKLQPYDVITGIDKTPWIIINRSKTKTRASIPLLPKAIKIIEKYKDHKRCMMTGILLPVKSAQKTNIALKEVAREAGVLKRVSFHLARHTFATTVTLTNGVPIETVSKMLGHTNIKTTQIYSKVVDVKISNDMAELKKKLE